MESLIQGEDEAEDLEVLQALAEDLAAKAAETGAGRLFQYLEVALSTTIRVTGREAVLVDDLGRTLDRLYRRNVSVARVSHAFEFLENEEVTDQGWIEAPDNLRLTPDMFVAEIAGHSMQPLIPDGSLCVFRHGVAGSRQGRLVLAESLDAIGNNKYAVKRYQGTKAAAEEGWRHERIRLESLNPEYPSWDFDPDEEKYRIIAEFVRVLD